MRQQLFQSKPQALKLLKSLESISSKEKSSNIRFLDRYLKQEKQMLKEKFHKVDDYAKHGTKVLVETKSTNCGANAVAARAGRPPLGA